MPPLLCVQNLAVRYGDAPAVEGVSFELNEGEILGIVGESGSGKSTILRAVAGLIGEPGEISRGDIRYRGERLVGRPEGQLRRLRGPEIGMVFQDCKAALCPVRTVGAQIHEAMRAHRRISRRESLAAAAKLMDKLGLGDPERILSSYPFELSGGMNQRVGICMAMLLQPKLLLADEPTSALDVTVQMQVVQELLAMRREYNTAMILVTHNIGLVRRMADRILVLKDGRTVDCGACERVLNAPADGYTKELMDSALSLKRA